VDKNYKDELQVRAGKLRQIGALYDEIAQRLEDREIPSAVTDGNISPTDATEDFISVVYSVVGSNKWSHGDLMRLWANSMTVTLVLQDETQKVATSSTNGMSAARKSKVSSVRQHRERRSDGTTLQQP
jgi:hypothetical protein